MQAPSKTVDVAPQYLRSRGRRTWKASWFSRPWSTRTDRSPPWRCSDRSR